MVFYIPDKRWIKQRSQDLNVRGSVTATHIHFEPDLYCSKALIRGQIMLVSRTREPQNVGYQVKPRVFKNLTVITQGKRETFRQQSP
jgi:hypothetical protein